MSVLSFRPSPPEFLIECEVRRRIQIKTSWNLILMQALATGIFDEWNERKDKSPWLFSNKKHTIQSYTGQPNLSNPIVSIFKERGLGWSWAECKKDSRAWFEMDWWAWRESCGRLARSLPPPSSLPTNVRILHIIISTQPAEGDNDMMLMLMIIQHIIKPALFLPPVGVA